MEGLRKSQLEIAQGALAKYLPRAVEVVTELLEGAENERVRLAAAEAIMDRSGLGKTQTTEVKVSQEEQEIARREAEEMIARIQVNQQQAHNVHKISLDALIVHEGEVEELPVVAVPPAGAIDASSS